MTTYQYNQLVQYHQRCSTSAVHSARNFIPRNPSSARANQTPYKANIAAYRDLCTTELKRKPHWDTVLSEGTIIPLIMAEKLDTVETAKYMLHQFGVQLQDEIKLAIQAVSQNSILLCSGPPDMSWTGTGFASFSRRSIVVYFHHGNYRFFICRQRCGYHPPLLRRRQL